MLVMALAHARKSGDLTLIRKYQDLLYKWSDFLVKNSLQLNGSYVDSPSPRPLIKLTIFSMTADGLVGATSNLALKGIMGIYAMGEIVKLLESRSRSLKRASYYLVFFFWSFFGNEAEMVRQDTARNYSRQWQGNAFSSDHVVSIYGDNTSWGMLYNLYAPRLLGADVISDMVSAIEAWESVANSLYAGFSAAEFVVYLSKRERYGTSYPACARTHC